MKTPEEMAREYADDWHKDCDYPEPLLSTVKKATKTIFLAGYEAAKPQWISVEERLPRPGQEVLIVDDQIMRVQAVSSYGKWHPYVNGSSCKPTHWMPLPELPKDVKE
jgi:hypothetical protein